jgi:ubiquinone/menaquinone biosynthesis C-methylase UbiE
MIEKTISTKQALKFYNRLGAGHDWAERYEGRAKRQALTRLNLTPGQHVLNAGIGTGQIQSEIEAAVSPDGVTFGLDLSPVMLGVTRRRIGSTSLCESDVLHLPFAPNSFDRIFSSYLFDLLPLNELPALLAGFRRVLRPGGRMVLVSLTEGVTPPSKAVVGLWKMAYAVSPVACGGCRPLQLANLVHEAGFNQVHREVVVQLAIPSEIIVAIL